MNTIGDLLSYKGIFLEAYTDPETGFTSIGLLNKDNSGIFSMAVNSFRPGKATKIKNALKEGSE